MDSSAVLAFLFGEPGADVVKAALPGAILSAINLAEVISKLCDLGMSSEHAWAAVRETGVRIVDTDIAQACKIGALRPATRSLGLSLGDRACLALARLRDLPALTADVAWSQLPGFDVILIRGARHDSQH